MQTLAVKLKTVSKILAVGVVVAGLSVTGALLAFHGLMKVDS